MAARLLWSRQAREDLLEIYAAVALENPSAAERLYDAIEAKTLKLADHPRMVGAGRKSGPERASWSSNPISSFTRHILIGSRTR